MKKHLLILSALLLTFVTACSPRHLTPIQTDSVRVEYRTQLMVVRDTAYVEIPKVTEKIITRDTSSYLENQYAESVAAVYGGYLYHTLETKPQKIAAVTEKAVEVRDTVIYQERTVEVPVEVEKKVTPKWCWILLAINALLFGGAAVKFYFKLKK